MGKIWLKSTDPNKQCCGCEGKASPCDSCCPGLAVPSQLDTRIVVKNGIPENTILNNFPGLWNTDIEYINGGLRAYSNQNNINCFRFKLNINAGEKLKIKTYSNYNSTTIGSEQCRQSKSAYNVTAGLNILPGLSTSLGSPDILTTKIVGKGTIINNNDYEFSWIRKYITITCFGVTISEHNLAISDNGFIVLEPPLNTPNVPFWRAELTETRDIYTFAAGSQTTSIEEQILIISDGISWREYGQFSNSWSDGNSTLFTRDPSCNQELLYSCNEESRVYNYKAPIMDNPQTKDVSFEGEYQFDSFILQKIVNETEDGSLILSEVEVTSTCLTLSLNSSEIYLLDSNNNIIDITSRLIKLNVASLP